MIAKRLRAVVGPAESGPLIIRQGQHLAVRVEVVSRTGASAYDDTTDRAVRLALHDHCDKMMRAAEALDFDGRINA